MENDRQQEKEKQMDGKTLTTKVRAFNPFGQVLRQGVKLIFFLYFFN